MSFDQNVYQKKRYDADPIFRETMRLRSRLNYTLRQQVQQGYDDVLIKALGVPYQAMYEHLAKQFTADMRWDNYGKVWEVDHIVPLRTATSVEDVHLLFYYMNLQPAPPVKNRAWRPA